MNTKHEGIVRTWVCQIENDNYVVVFEWDTRKHMVKALNKKYWNVRGPKCNKNTLAAYHTFRSNTNARTLKIKPLRYGEIHVVKDDYGVGVAAHEIQHIVCNYALAKGWDMERDNEKIALISGDMTYWFWIGQQKGQ